MWQIVLLLVLIAAAFIAWRLRPGPPAAFPELVLPEPASMLRRLGRLSSWRARHRVARATAYREQLARRLPADLAAGDGAHLPFTQAAYAGTCEPGRAGAAQLWRRSPGLRRSAAERAAASGLPLAAAADPDAMLGRPGFLPSTAAWAIRAWRAGGRRRPRILDAHAGRGAVAAAAVSAPSRVERYQGFEARLTDPALAAGFTNLLAQGGGAPRFLVRAQPFFEAAVPAAAFDLAFVAAAPASLYADAEKSWGALAPGGWLIVSLSSDGVNSVEFLRDVIAAYLATGAPPFEMFSEILELPKEQIVKPFGLIRKKLV